MSTEKDEVVGPLDADDVEGHGSRHQYGVAPTDDDDVEGHWTSKQHL